MPDATPEQITLFIERWEQSGAAERSNYVLFLSELCALLDLPRPDPASPDNAQNTYVFERAITRKNPDGTTTALPLTTAQLAMLTDAVDKDWSAVEPSIFGTLLTRALDPRERHKLGAEYTPRAYVERLIRPTIIGPLRDEWDAVRVAAATLHDEAHLTENQSDQLQADATAKTKCKWSRLRA